MTFFYDLNKRLKDVLEAPKSVHQTLNERDMSRTGKKVKEQSFSNAGTPSQSALVKSAATAATGGGGSAAVRSGNLYVSEKEGTSEGLGSMVKKIGGGMKKAAGKAMDAIAPGDEALLKDLQKKTGMPQTGKKPQTMAFHKSNSVDDNAVVAKEEYGPLEETPAKPDYIDLDKDGNRKESMKKAAADKKKRMAEDSENARGQVLLPASQWLRDPRLETQVMSLKVTGINVTDPAKGFYGDDGNDREYPGKYSFLVSTKAKNPMYFKDFLNMVMKKKPNAEVIGQMQSGPAPAVAEDWDTMMKDVERRRSEVKPGHKVAGHKGDIEKTDTGIRHTRRYDPKTGETDTGDEVGADGQSAKRGRGRPKGSTGKIGAKGPSGKSKLMTREEIEEAIAALEQAGYSVEERKLTKPEMSKREEVVKSMKKHKGDFERRYGDRGEEVMYATATKMAKKKNKTKDEVDETTVAGSVAPSAAEPKSKGKGGMTFGKGIYDSMNREVEAMIAEGMNVSMNMSNDGHGGPSKSLTVTATDDDAEMLGKLLKMAGLGSSAGGCGCGSSPCSCKSAERVEENKPDWPTDEVVTGADDDHLTRWAGGLNKPKTTVAGDGQTTVPVTAVQVSKQADEDLKEQDQVMSPGSDKPEADLGEELQRMREMAGLKSAMEADSDIMKSIKSTAGAAIGAGLGGLAGGPLGAAGGAALGQLAHKGVEADIKANRDSAVKEDDMEEGNRFLYNLNKAREAGKKKADLDGDGDLEKVRESINSMWKAYKG